jgi:hypothetical protein
MPADQPTRCIGRRDFGAKPWGFLLIFLGRSPESLARQLRDFDVDEWRTGLELEKTFERELEGSAPAERLRDSHDIRAACPEVALSCLNQDVHR